MNRRSIQTRSDITQVFLELLNEKPLNKITVKEVSEKARVTRATFYAHYHDMYDLLEQSRAVAVNHITIIIEEGIRENSFEFFLFELFSYFDEHQEVFALILGENGDMSFLVSALRKLREQKDSLITENGINLLSGEKVDQKLSEFQFTYLAGGILNILTTWLNQEERMSVEEISSITARFVENTCLVDISA